MLCLLSWLRHHEVRSIQQELISNPLPVHSTTNTGTSCRLGNGQFVNIVTQKKMSPPFAILTAALSEINFTAHWV